MSIKRLVESGIDLNLQNSLGYTALRNAVDRLPMDKDDSKNKHTFPGLKYVQKMFGGQEYKPEMMIDYLIEHGADVTIPTCDWLTPIHQAVLWGELGVVKTLVEHGADIHQRDVWGNTPLNTVGGFFKQEIFDYLVSCGADVKSRNMHGENVYDKLGKGK